MPIDPERFAAKPAPEDMTETQIASVIHAAQTEMLSWSGERPTTPSDLMAQVFEELAILARMTSNSESLVRVTRQAGVVAVRVFQFARAPR